MFERSRPGVDRDGMLSIVDDALGILVIRVAGRCDELGWEIVDTRYNRIRVPILTDESTVRAKGKGRGRDMSRGKATPGMGRGQAMAWPKSTTPPPPRIILGEEVKIEIEEDGEPEVECEGASLERQGSKCVAMGTFGENYEFPFRAIYYRECHTSVSWGRSRYSRWSHYGRVTIAGWDTIARAWLGSCFETSIVRLVIFESNGKLLLPECL
uniref:Uncharacterized protein n=1 Tax=Solanum tuberosum TaxID=4113 RepID=M1DV20_SOLTU